MRMRFAAVALVGAAALALSACTTGPDDTSTPSASASTAAATSSANPPPSDDDESQDQWAHLKTLVVAKYPDSEPSMVGSSFQATSFHLSPAKTSGTTGMAFAVSCTGGGAWRIRVDQETPRTVRGTCDGPDPAVPDAVQLDPHPTGVQIRMTPPKGVRFWMVASYTTG